MDIQEIMKIDLREATIKDAQLLFNWANDPETRRSVSGYIVYVHGVPVVWKSKANNL